MKVAQAGKKKGVEEKKEASYVSVAAEYIHSIAAPSEKTSKVIQKAKDKAVPVGKFALKCKLNALYDYACWSHIKMSSLWFFGNKSIVSSPLVSSSCSPLFYYAQGVGYH